MTLLADLAIRSAIVVFVGLIACAALRHRSAALRHTLLAAALFAGAAIVPLAAVLPGWNVPLPDGFPEPAAARAAAVAVSVTAGADAAATHTSPASVALWIWFAGFAVGAGTLLAGLGRLAWIARRARPVRDGAWVEIAAERSAVYGLTRRVTILEADAPDLLATFGVLRPSVLVPPQAREWSRDRVHAILCHELAHVRRFDWLVQVAAEAVRTIFWFNPLVWIACARLRRESEQAADDLVLDAGVPAPIYASHLLELARTCRRRGRPWLAAIPIARPSTLERRITAMLNPTVDRRALSGRAIALTVALITLAALPVGALRAAQTAPQALVGAVYDTTGAVVPGVQLTLGDGQQQTGQATTDRAGRFTFASVAPGRYTLEASLPGFRTLRQEIDLRTARDWDRAITLQVGEMRESIHVQASRIAGPAGPTQAQAGQPLKVGGNIRVPRKLHDVRPVFPVSMREAAREGTVPMEAIIGTDGSVTSVRVLSADIHPDFAISAVDAVRQWRFDPTLLNGKPVEVRMIVSVEFKLSD